MIITRVNDGAYLFVNEAAMLLTGFSRQDWEGKSAATNDLGLWADDNDRQRLLEALRTQGKVTAMEFPYRRHDGAIRIGQVAARFITYQGDLCLLTISRDITEQNQIEKELQESRDRLRRLTEEQSQLLELYSEKITSIADEGELVSLLRDQVLARLRVRQSALLRLTPENTLNVVYKQELESSQIHPGAPLAHSFYRRYVSPDPATRSDDHYPHGWVRVSLPLLLKGKPVGVWLLGRREPDDHYLPAEIAILQALAHQAAIVLINFDITEQLKDLYRSDIDRTEKFHQRLAQDLHDDVLSHLAQMKALFLEGHSRAEIDQAYQEAVNRIRSIINTMRPLMLHYGLKAALKELIDELEQMNDRAVAIRLDVADIGARYPQEVELHLFRIIQQAGRNTLQHAKASYLSIKGALGASNIDILVEDDGIGFESGSPLRIDELAAQRRFGLVSMLERAALIGAHLQILAAPGQGTRMHITWQAAVP